MMNSGKEGQSLAATLGATAGSLLHYMFQAPEPKQKSRKQRKNDAQQAQGAAQIGAACGVALHALFAAGTETQTKEEEDYLYYYTSRRAARMILQKKFIKTSVSGDGQGVFLTSVPPEKHQFDSDAQNSQQPIRKMYFRFRRDELKGVRLVPPAERNLWLYPRNLQLNEKMWEHGEAESEMEPAPRPGGRQIATLKYKDY